MHITHNLHGKLITAIALLIFTSVTGVAQEKKVLVIGIDGLLSEAVGTEYTPWFNSLYQDDNGILMLGYTEDLTFSGPSWSSIFTGVHHDRHQVNSNSYNGHDFSDYPHFLKRLKEYNEDLHTSAFVTWLQLPNNFQTVDGSSDGVDHLVFHDRREDNGDVNVTKAAVDLMKSGNPGAVFFYQNDIDGAGHRHGFSMDVSEYRDQVRVTDGRVGSVLEALYNRPGVINGEEDWLIILVTDHGGVGTGHSGNLYRQRLIPIVLNGSAVNNDEQPWVRPRNVDVSRTVLTYMGVPEEDQAELDGHDMLSLGTVTQPVAGYRKNLIFNGDAEYDRGFETQERDQVISGWRDQEHIGSKDGHHSMTVIKSDNGNLFSGGIKGNSSKTTQLLDVSPLKSDINNRETSFYLSAHLGSSAGSSDRMALTVYFMDSNQDLIGTAIIHNTAEDRHTQNTSLTYKNEDGLVPPGTVSVLFELHATGGAEEGIKAYADKLKFKLARSGQE